MQLGKHQRLTLVDELVLRNGLVVLFNVVTFYWQGIELGKFPGGAPFDNVGLTKPRDPSKLDVNFYLYTRNNPDSPETLLPGNIAETKFDGTRRTQFVIHGFMGTGSRTSEWMLGVKNELLKKDDYNVIFVDWKKGSRTLNYAQAASDTRVVGAIVAAMIEKLHTEAIAQFNNIHLIGHSLGAHIAGYAGALKKVDRITGLDPAGPLFEGTKAVVRLDPTDADFVDAIHTDAKSLMAGGLGIQQAVGHADFYPNNGRDQPGCPPFNPFNPSSVKCSHDRVRDLFIESINTACPFTACEGTSKCSRMGFYADLDRTPGRYFLTTNDASPFCITSKKRGEFESPIQTIMRAESLLMGYLNQVEQ